MLTARVSADRLPLRPTEPLASPGSGTGAERTLILGMPAVPIGRNDRYFLLIRAALDGEVWVDEDCA